ncbi:4-(cytidine 5'-diphospho)-2-C-methyl-D-erythritol kinase [Pseudonocardia endophytica]|uniref:4-diphosphocytidyl-2-C-methyl-D-erythritol kinase n=1 Tax=Pseudonocardia endophytica TaxID=401976 RepID=A0A4R1I8X5_PSEEN|nr:4-(cytidine 5'-diphospho)-2-C-methyl-D-erythritol kinase [Pseudonocardia endophytica]TCK26652.1 4-diphosphocytidyl-2-C-methyl-D-erythritol kinase [Pseudonocardia endophytica]
MLSAAPRPVTVRVPAKINLHLAVGGVRADGYHDLVTVFHAVSLFDEVTVEQADEPALEVHGDAAAVSPLDRRGSGVAEVPLDATNLAWRAVELLAAKAEREPNVKVVLRKGIPVAGGMAGGSADAAGTLVALSQLWRMELGRDDLSTLAAELGSDVTFALHGGTALGTGRGEQVIPVLARHRLHWVIALARGGLSTPAVFGELDRLRADGEPEERPVEPVLEALAGGDPRQLALNLGNDLQVAAVSMAPDLRRTLRAGVAAGALAGLVSGSGPTCAFLCADADSAVEVATELAGAGVCRTVRVAQGPVAGARVVDDAQPPDTPPGSSPPPPGPGAWPPVRA